MPSDYSILIESIVPLFSYMLSNMTDNLDWNVKNQNEQTIIRCYCTYVLINWICYISKRLKAYCLLGSGALYLSISVTGWVT